MSYLYVDKQRRLLAADLCLNFVFTSAKIKFSHDLAHLMYDFANSSHHRRSF